MGVHFFSPCGAPKRPLLPHGPSILPPARTMCPQQPYEGAATIVCIWKTRALRHREAATSCHQEGWTKPDAGQRGPRGSRLRSEWQTRTGSSDLRKESRLLGSALAQAATATISPTPFRPDPCQPFRSEASLLGRVHPTAGFPGEQLHTVTMAAKTEVLRAPRVLQGPKLK